MIRCCISWGQESIQYHMHLFMGPSEPKDRTLGSENVHQHEWMEDLILSPGLPSSTSFLSSSLWRSQMLCVWPLGLSPASTFSPQLQSFHNSCTAQSHCTVTLPLTSPNLGACCFLSLEFFPFSFFLFFFFLASVTFLFSPFSISVPVLLYCYTGTGVLYRSQCSSRVSSQKPSRLPTHLAAPSAI